MRWVKSGAETRIFYADDKQYLAEHDSNKDNQSECHQVVVVQIQQQVLHWPARLYDIHQCYCSTTVIIIIIIIIIINYQ